MPAKLPNFAPPLDRRFAHTAGFRFHQPEVGWRNEVCQTNSDFSEMVYLDVIFKKTESAYLMKPSARKKILSHKMKCVSIFWPAFWSERPDKTISTEFLLLRVLTRFQNPEIGDSKDRLPDCVQNISQNPYFLTDFCHLKSKRSRKVHSNKQQARWRFYLAQNSKAPWVMSWQPLATDLQKLRQNLAEFEKFSSMISDSLIGRNSVHGKIFFHGQVTVCVIRSIDWLIDWLID